MGIHYYSLFLIIYNMFRFSSVIFRNRSRMVLLNNPNVRKMMLHSSYNNYNNGFPRSTLLNPNERTNELFIYEKKKGGKKNKGGGVGGKKNKSSNNDDDGEEGLEIDLDEFNEQMDDAIERLKENLSQIKTKVGPGKKGKKKKK